MQSRLVLTLLVIAVSFALTFLLIYVRKSFFVNKDYYVASNTVRGFALFADFVLLNSLNFVFILLKVFLDPHYSKEFQLFAEQIFHSGGVGLGDWFWLTQLRLLCFYFFYSVIFEMIFGSTICGYFLGLRIGKINLFKVILRNIVKLISILFWPLFLVLSNTNNKRKWIHDLIAGTVVIQEK